MVFSWCLFPSSFDNVIKVFYILKKWGFFLSFFILRQQWYGLVCTVNLCLLALQNCPEVIIGEDDCITPFVGNLLNAGLAYDTILGYLKMVRTVLPGKNSVVLGVSKVAPVRMPTLTP